MIKRADEENPTAFRLPQDIRQFFAGGKSSALLFRGDWLCREACATYTALRLSARLYRSSFVSHGADGLVNTDSRGYYIDQEETRTKYE